MIANKDFLSYCSDNQKFIELLCDNSPIIYDRIKNIIVVLNIITDAYEKDQKIDEELEIIFETGFSYLHEQLEIIKIYYNDYFNKDILLFKHYEKIINYLLYVDDLGEALSEKNCYTIETKETLSKLSKDLDTILQKKEKFTDEDLSNYDIFISSCVPSKVDITTTDQIFAYILEEIA